jgi:NADH:ubiquinone oxidoreductase subunit E
MNEAKHTISICMGSSCAARGNMRNLSRIRDYLQESGIEAQVVLRGALCNNACTTAPT